MKHLPLYLTSLALILLCYCEQELHFVTGFDSPIEKNSSGLIMVHLAEDAKSLVLEGSISVFEGEVEVTLLDPEDRVAFRSTFQASKRLPVYEALNIVPGFWTLSYKSLGGRGSISLHLHCD